MFYNYYLWVEIYSNGNSQQFTLRQQIALRHHAAQAKESAVLLGHYF